MNTFNKKKYKHQGLDDKFAFFYIAISNISETKIKIDK